MATTENLNKVSPLRYDIYNKMLAMAEFFFGEDTDYLKAGFMGWVVECLTMFMRDSALQKTMLKNETTLNTAVMTKTVYEWAKMFGISIPQATPASCDFIFTLDCNELDSMMSKRKGEDQDSKYGSEVINSLAGTPCFIIDRGDSIKVDSYTYTMERSIIIYKNQVGSYIVKYCNTETPVTTMFDNHGENILKTVLREDSETGNRYLSFTVKAYQYKTTTITKQVTSSAFIESENHVFEFDDQFCGVRLKYRKGNETISIPMYFSDSERNPVTSVYCYYDLIDDQTLRVKFKPKSFLPSVGSSLICDIYSTKGKKANTKFNAQPIMSLSDETYRSMSILVSLVDYQSMGGKDKISTTDLKQNIIRELSTRDVIVTEEDLNNYFKLLGGFFESINDGQVKFIKKRDDLIRRTFNAYVLLRDGFSIDGTSEASTNYRSEVIPTNTVDVEWLAPATSATGLTNNDGNAIQKQYIEKVLSGSNVTYRLVNSPAADVNTENLFRIPFYTQVYLTPIRIVKYIYDMTDDSTSLSYQAITNSSTLYMSPSTVSIVKDATTNQYVLNFLFHTDFDLSQTWGNSEITLKIYDSNTFTSYGISGSDYLNIVSELPEGSSVYNSTIQLKLPVDSDQPFIMVGNNSANLNYGQKVRLNIGSIITVAEEAKVGLIVKGTFNNQTYECEFISDSTLTWFKNLDDIMSSEIETTITTTGTGASATKKITSIKLKEVPIVAADFYSNTLSRSAFINTLLTYIKLLKENKSKLETNTSFNLKFMNTFGESASYTSSSTNLRLELSIYTSSTDTAIHEEIKHYIRHLVDLANEGKKLRVSTVLAMVTAAYNQYIDHIEFEGLNGTFDQYIEALPEDESTTIVPEYFNLDRNHLDEDIKFIVI